MHAFLQYNLLLVEKCDPVLLAVLLSLGPNLGPKSPKPISVWDDHITSFVARKAGGDGTRLHSLEHRIICDILYSTVQQCCSVLRSEKSEELAKSVTDRDTQRYTTPVTSLCSEPPCQRSSSTPQLLFVPYIHMWSQSVTNSHFL